jgi:hypothetical protein
MTIKEKIIEIGDKILTVLLDYKQSNPEFTFSLRSRDSPQSKEVRLEKGQWFQGSDYIYVPLFKKGDNDRKVKTLGFVLKFNKDSSISDNYIEISFKKGSEAVNEQAFHKELASKLDISLNEMNFGRTEYESPEEYLENLKDYLDRVRPMALTLIEKYSLQQKFLISEKVFQKHVTKIMEIKKRLQTTSSNELDSNGANQIDKQ